MPLGAHRERDEAKSLIKNKRSNDRCQPLLGYDVSPPSTLPRSAARSANPRVSRVVFDLPPSP